MSNSEAPVDTLCEDDDLEEGELKDDDDDDDDDELATDPAKDADSKSNKTSTKSKSDDESSAKSSSSSSSSSQSSRSSSLTRATEERPERPPSSKSSSRNESHYEPYNRISSSYNHESRIKSRHSLIDKYRLGREREDPSEKAAKLISMRTKLLEARSREIEMKFQKNKIRLLSPPPSKLTIETSSNVKMTLTLPSISYNENPNPPPVVALTNIVVESANSSKSKRDERQRSKSKKSKKKKKKSSKRHKKTKSSSGSKKVSHDTEATDPPKSETVPCDTSDHVGPRTPPDNHVLTLNDEQVEWPSHLIKMTTTLPSISYSINPDFVNPIDGVIEDSSGLLKRRRSTVSSLTDNKRFKSYEKSASFSSSPSRKTISPLSHKNEDGSSFRKYQSTKTYDLDLNHDYSWYYNYFMSSFDMDANQSQHQALSAVVSGSYNPEVLEKWLNAKGLSKRSSKDPDIKKQLYPFVTKELFSSIPDTLDNPNGTAEGTVRTIVTRISRNVFKNCENSQPDEQEEQTKCEFMVKQENDLNHPIVTESIKNDTGDENLPDGLNEDKSSKAIDVKQEKSDQEKCPTPLEVSERSITLRPVQPHITIIKSQKEIIFPNGQTLPAGTIQRIVHPYPRLDTESLGPCFDLY